MIFECQEKCGWCCTHLGAPFPSLPSGTLWFNISSNRCFPTIFPFEREILVDLTIKKNLNINVPIGEFWVDKSRKLIIILDYLFANPTCPFYNPKKFSCPIYHKRPVICRMFPIVSFHSIPFKDPKVAVDVVNCPSAIRIFGKSKKVVCPKGLTFARIFGPYYWDAVYADMYMDSAKLYIDILARTKRLTLQPFKLKAVRKVLRSKEYEKMEFERFYESFEKRKFRDLVKSVYFDKLHQDNIETIQRGFEEAVIDENEINAWINEYW